MHYPFWYVPLLTSPMLIAAIATIHVFAAMFAVGGGFVMALGTRTGDRELTDYFRQFAWFFVLITVVYGAVTGIGIWWTIGLASPLATEELIHIFVFAWAMEYDAFILEIVSAFVFLYGWNRLAARTRQVALWIYAGAAWISLVLITGITAFMAHTGGWQAGLWPAFWNPQTVPQIVARTGVSLMLAALFIFLHAAIKLRDREHLLAQVAGLTARWAMMGGGLVILGGAAWYFFSPPSAQAALVGAAALNILMGLLFGLTGLVVVMLYLGPYRNPRWINLGFAILFFSMGLAATAAGEFVREAVRKPYIVYGRILGNGIRSSEVARLRSQGFLDGGIWTRLYLADRYPRAFGPDGRVEGARLLSLPARQREEIGRVIFQYHCNDCHAVRGYSGVSQLTRGWTWEMIHTTVIHLNRAHFFMPPWCGTPEEAVILTDYLKSVSRPYPPGLIENGGAGR